MSYSQLLELRVKALGDKLEPRCVGVAVIPLEFGDQVPLVALLASVLAIVLAKVLAETLGGGVPKVLCPRPAGGAEAKVVGGARPSH